MKKYITLVFLFSASKLMAQADLNKRLDDLRIPDDKITPIVSADKYYLVNERYSSLTNRHEVSMLGGHNFNAVSHLDNKQLGAAYRYHLDPRFSFALKYQVYQNQLTDAGKKLYDDQKILPDADYALKSTTLMVNMNTIYGKMRITEKQVVYFDQYVGIGYGDIDLARGLQKMINLDLGFAFWLGKNMSARIGLNNEFYEQRKLTGVENIHNAMGYIEFGYLFGKGRI